MKKNSLVFGALIALVVLLGGTFVILEWFGPKSTIALDLRGTPGREFMGRVTVDSEEKRIAGKLPATFSYAARQIDFVLVPLDDDWLQNIDLRIVVDGKAEVEMNARGGRGDYYRPTLLPGWRKRGGIHGLPEHEIAALRKELEQRP